jgi:hypothetical protein
MFQEASPDRNSPPQAMLTHQAANAVEIFLGASRQGRRAFRQPPLDALSARARSLKNFLAGE